MSNDINQQQTAADQKISEMVQQSRILEAYMNDTITREATVTKLIEEARLASSAVQNVMDESEVESLMPVGIGVYMKALVPPVKKLLVNVGAGVVVEKNREDTVNYIESRIKEFETALSQLYSQKQQIEMRMEQIQKQVNQMLQQSSGGSSSAAKSQHNSYTHNNRQ
ncbi:MAG: prefoldin subunit alpha [Thermoproteota archaeon]|jgi:prefoldin alpha subunit|nr:prefoldin subunit alpha [Thermoproteota archaeon]HYY50646.1 prefoldin subunit alpha [Nitrososphaeraceae archaeon]